MRKRKEPSPDDGRRNMAPEEALDHTMDTANIEPPNGDAAPEEACSHSMDTAGFEPSNGDAARPSRQDAGDAGGPSCLVPRRGSSTGARPLHSTERLEHGCYGARVVFGAQLIEYENGLDYAAKLSTPAYFQGYTAIPLGNAPRLPSRRWANGMLDGAKEAGAGDPAKGGAPRRTRRRAILGRQEEHKRKGSRFWALRL